MAGRMVREESGNGPSVLVTSREPQGPKKAGSKGSMGDRALMDAIIIVVIAWAVLFVLAFSLRSHNI